MFKVLLPGKLFNLHSHCFRCKTKGDCQRRVQKSKWINQQNGGAFQLFRLWNPYMTDIIIITNDGGIVSDDGANHQGHAVQKGEGIREGTRKSPYSISSRSVKRQL